MYGNNNEGNPMLIDQESARYVLAVKNHLLSGAIPADSLTDRCPECNEVQTASDNHGHLVMRISEAEDDYRVAVVIGCEWYWVIDPSLVGIQTTWSDWRTPDGIDTPGDI